MEPREIVSDEDWLAARKALLAEEKAFTIVAVSPNSREARKQEFKVIMAKSLSMLGSICLCEISSSHLQSSARQNH